MAILPSGAPAASRTGIVYANAAGTVLADILAYQPGNPTVPGAAIAGSVVTTDAYGMLPLFWWPDSVDVVWISVNGGPITAINADYDARLDAVETSLTAKANAATYGWQWLPSDHGYLAWAYDVANASGTTNLAAGALMLVKVKLPVAATITNVVCHLAGPGATLTAGQNLAALFDATGARLGITADQSAAWTTVGPKAMALTAPVAAPAGAYYVGLLFNGTTTPAFSRSVAASATTIANAGLTGAAFRFASSGTGQTAMPASFSPAAASGNAGAIWAGLS
jgi:hypothetical protein